MSCQVASVLTDHINTVVVALRGSMDSHTPTSEDSRGVGLVYTTYPQDQGSCPPCLLVYMVSMQLMSLIVNLFQLLLLFVVVTKQ